MSEYAIRALDASTWDASGSHSPSGFPQKIRPRSAED